MQTKAPDAIFYMYKRITSDFFARSTLKIAPELLGKYLVRCVGGKTLAGKITEVEAYIGEKDLACHASKGRTKRSEILYQQPGTLYVYMIYGMYWCMNIVTECDGFPAALLIRAAEPEEGIDVMLRNRKNKNASADSYAKTKLANGPGKLCQAFGIDGKLNGKLIGRNSVIIEDRGVSVFPSQIIRTPRIGVDYAKEWAKKPWRFVLNLQE
jgi:DNA-3-methyladenine glycosylase